MTKIAPTLQTFFTDKSNGIQSVEFQQLVTLKGGEYFFVPSISALSDDLAQTSQDTT